MSHALKSRMIAIIHNIIVGFVVSIVMINLGAALGILSERGAFIGMVSAGVIALITSAFGGTAIQGSGTTAPMSAVTAVIVAFAIDQLPTEIAGVSADHFVNIVLFLTALLVILFGVLRLGRFIAFVPTLVVSGFMCGIALIIWILQIEVLFGIDQTALIGPMWMNIGVALCTLVLTFITPYLLSKISSRLSALIPGTLVALILVSVATYYFNIPVELLSIENSLQNFDDLKALITAQIPTTITLGIILLALPFAFKLAALCYIDTLLTSLIVDKMRGTKTKQNQELVAQGFATACVGFIGGVPGAQSTVPSVLAIKEGATMRLAGIAAGIFVLMNVVLFADLMNVIPKAVFAGILLKVGYDVFDFKPLWVYLKKIISDIRDQRKRGKGYKEIGMISGTALATAFIDLILAVGFFSFIYHIFKKSRSSDNHTNRPKK